MKLDENEIAKLIEEALSERKISVVYPDLGNIDSNNAADRKKIHQTLSKTDIDNLAGRDGENSNISFDDFADAASKDDATFKALKGSKAAADVKKAAKKAKDLVDKGFKSSKEMASVDTSKDLEFAKSKSIAFKALNTISADPSDSTAMGTYPEGIATATNHFFKNSNSLFDRVQKVNEFMNKIYTGKLSDRLGAMKKEAGGENSDLLAGILFCDYLSTVVQETDSGAAAYNFESLLAMMSGGRVMGKAKTAAGKMGATDFQTNTGIAGSSKYYAKPTEIGQAPGGFDINKPVFYIVALKKKAGAVAGQTTTGGVSDPREIKELHIFNLIIMKYKYDSTTEKSYFYIKNGAGEIKEIVVTGNTKVKFGKAEYLKNPIVLKVGRKSDDFQGALNKGIDKAKDDTAEIVTFLKDALAGSQLANQKMQAYASSGEKSTGDDALKALLAAETNIKKLGTKAFSQTIKPAQESKMSDLDKLILEVLKENT